MSGSNKKNLVVVFLLLVAVAANQGCTQSGGGEAKKESVYDRIMRTGEIRAAYITYPPALIRDTKTGKLSGIFYDTLEQAAHNLGLKVKWTEEVGWGAQIEGLQTDRYDIVGSPVWANPTRGKLTSMSVPVYYSGIGIWVRANDNRFDDDWSTANAKGVRISTIDGETGDLIARSQFPKAKRISMPQLTDISRLFLEVTSNKSDMAFAEPYYGYKQLQANPGSVKNVAAERPVRVLGNCYMFKKNEYQLKHMLDVAVEDLLNSGFVDQLLDKYSPKPNTFYRVGYPYRAVRPASLPKAATP